MLTAGLKWRDQYTALQDYFFSFFLKGVLLQCQVLDVIFSP